MSDGFMGGCRRTLATNTTIWGQTIRANGPSRLETAYFLSKDLSLYRVPRRVFVSSESSSNTAAVAYW